MSISLLIANYNNGHFFESCFQSIQSQSFQDFEVIIMDDKSTDNSVTLIKNFIKDDKRFTLIEQEENRGCGFIKSALIKLAQGEICGFLDPDDSLAPNALEIMVKKHKKHPKYAAIYSQFYECDSALNPIKVSKLTKQIRNNYNLFFNVDTRITHFFTFKKSYYLKTEGINPKYRIAEDQDLYLKLSEVGPFKFIEQPLYYYRIHSDGVSQKKGNKGGELKREVIWNALRRRGISRINNIKMEKPNDILKIYEIQSKTSSKIIDFLHIKLFN